MGGAPQTGESFGVTMTNARTHSQITVHSEVKMIRNSEVYPVMIQLNIGSKGCKNLEGKKESASHLPLAVPLSLSHSPPPFSL